MNHIHKLQNELDRQSKALQHVLTDLRDFSAELQYSRKYRQQPDGSRGDWIATADVVRRIQEIVCSMNEGE